MPEPGPFKRKRPPRPQDTIQDAVSRWLSSVASPEPGHEADSWREALTSVAPKRFTIYEPMALLPAGSFAQPQWQSVLSRVDEETREKLWVGILSVTSRTLPASRPLTHLAVTEGIPLHNDGGDAENVLRSPIGLRMLYGDFGPSAPVGDSGELGSQDFDRAFWASTKQNGIYQTWAPRWTMFSRGNVKEKARLLDFRSRHGDETDKDVWAVDLYAGIGYFVFSYASLGMRVLCWELNPWSVEGLRRGALANRWTVKVVQGSDLDLPTEDVTSTGEQIVVFLEDNQKALERIRCLQQQPTDASSRCAREIRHVNCGFLPTSEPTWRAAFDMADRSSETWLHLHENVGAVDTETRREELQSRFRGWAATEGHHREVEVEHVELVKTFAPGVWHCVFDVHITRSINDT